MLLRVSCRIQHMHLTTFLKSENLKKFWPEGFRSEMWVCTSRVGKGTPGAGTGLSKGQEACRCRLSENVYWERGFEVGMWQGQRLHGAD